MLRPLFRPLAAMEVHGNCYITTKSKILVNACLDQLLLPILAAAAVARRISSHRGRRFDAARVPPRDLPPLSETRIWKAISECKIRLKSLNVLLTFMSLRVLCTSSSCHLYTERIEK